MSHKSANYLQLNHILGQFKVLASKHINDDNKRCRLIVCHPHLSMLSADAELFGHNKKLQPNFYPLGYTKHENNLAKLYALPLIKCLVKFAF